MYTCYIGLNIILPSTKQCILKDVFNIGSLLPTGERQQPQLSSIENGKLKYGTAAPITAAPILFDTCD